MNVLKLQMNFSYLHNEDWSPLTRFMVNTYLPIVIGLAAFEPLYSITWAGAETCSTVPIFSFQINDPLPPQKWNFFLLTSKSIWPPLGFLFYHIFSLFSLPSTFIFGVPPKEILRTNGISPETKWQDRELFCRNEIKLRIVFRQNFGIEAGWNERKQPKPNILSHLTRPSLHRCCQWPLGFPRNEIVC